MESEPLMAEEGSLEFIEVYEEMVSKLLNL